MTPIEIQTNAARDVASPLVVAGCTHFDLTSIGSGQDYEIFVYVPDEPAPPSGFPVIYVLDANSDFLLVTETVRRASRRPSATGIAAAIVVGIGYPNTEAYDTDRRFYDFTRGPSVEEDCLATAGFPAFGGQDSYVEFLKDQLLPHIAESYRTDVSSTTLIGHSLAGYFVLSLLARQPDLFSAYVSFSPSVWWDPSGLNAEIAKAGKPQRTIRVYCAVGRWERALAPWQMQYERDDNYLRLRKARRMIDNAFEVSEKIDTSFSGKAHTKFEVGEDEDHATVVPALLCRALRFALCSP